MKLIEFVTCFFRRSLFRYLDYGAQDKREYFKNMVLFLKGNIYCEPSLEPSRRDGSKDGSQNMYLWKIWLIIPKLFLLPLLIWSTVIDCFIYPIFFLIFTPTSAIVLFSFSLIRSHVFEFKFIYIYKIFP